MSPKERGEKIRNQILRDVKYHPNNIAQHISQIFAISRQAAHKHLKKLVDEEWLEAIGSTRRKTYRLGQRRIDEQIFDRYSGGEDEDYAFNRTVIPVIKAKLAKENLVSRSQAKRLLARVENFKYVFFDFSDVDSIGQAFADEIFRVFQLSYPAVSIEYQNACPDVEKMIKRAKAH